jgi:hypothetical protein
VQGCLLKYGTNPEFKQWLRRVKPEKARHVLTQAAKDAYEKARTDEERDLALKRATWGIAEQSWSELERPYYNVWPIAIDLSRQVKLELPFASFKTPFEAIVLRFSKGHEPHGLSTAMLFWLGPRIQIMARPTQGEDTINLEMRYTPEEQVEAWMARLQEDAKELEQIGALLVRLVVFVGLLSHDRDMITPIVLSKDQARYDSAETPDEKKWLEDRAARRAGRGFEVCKGLELDRNASPHWRNPHLCLFWTGLGRTVPIIKMRSGAVIQRVSMAEVPTGYLGPENDDEPNAIDEKTPREAISKSRRFDVMKRDGFRCQLCGATREQGAILHVDHKTPLAKGGSNEDDNLWTLCDFCNLGKSDKALL